MRLTKKRKEIMSNAIYPGYFWTAMSSEFADDEKEQFKERFGVGYDEAEKARQALVEFLDK